MHLLLCESSSVNVTSILCKVLESIRSIFLHIVLLECMVQKFGLRNLLRKCHLLVGGVVVPLEPKLVENQNIPHILFSLTIWI